MAGRNEVVFIDVITVTIQEDLGVLLPPVGYLQKENTVTFMIILRGSYILMDLFRFIKV